MKMHHLTRHRLPVMSLLLGCLLAAGLAMAQLKDTFSDNSIYTNSGGTGNGFVSNSQGGSVYESGGYVTMSGSGYATMVIRSNDAINPYQAAATKTTWKFGTITYDASWQRFWVGYRLNGSNNDHFYPDNPNLQGLYISIVSNTGGENNYTYKGNLVANSGGSRTILASWNWSDLNQLSGLVVTLTTTSTNYNLAFSGATATPTYTFGSASGTLTGIGNLGNTYNVGVHNQASNGSTVHVDEIEVSSGVTTKAATAVTTTGATLNGVSFPGGLDTTAWFEYGTSATLSGATSTTAQSTGSVSSGVDYSQAISGLSANTTYYFRAVENSGSGTREGSILSFITGPEISVSQPQGTELTDGATTLSFASAAGVAGTARTFTITNTGGVTLTGLSATVDGDFPGDYAMSTLSTSTLEAGASTTLTVTFTAGAIGSRGAVLHIASDDVDENPFDITLAGKGVSSVPGYVWSGNFPSTSSGSNVIWGSHFTALDACTLNHLGVYDHDQDGLSQAIPVGLWDVATQQLLASTTVSSGTEDPLFGSCRQHVLDTPVVLQAGKRYAIAAFYPSGSSDSYGYYGQISTDDRVAYYGYAYYYGSQLTFPYYNGTASSGSAQYFGASFMLDASPAAPTVTTQSPALGDSEVTLRARVNPNSRVTTVSFEYSIDPTLSSGVTTTAEQNLSAGFAGQNVSSSAITNLVPNTTYYVRAVAVNALGTTVGSIRSFRTSPPVPGYQLIGSPIAHNSQYYYGNNWGSYFITTKACALTHLGVYDYNQDGLGVNTPVGIWDSNGILLGSTTLRSGTTDQLVGAFRCRQLDMSVDLAANTRYYVAAFYGAYSPDLIGVDAVMQTDQRILYEGAASNYSGELSFPSSTQTGDASFARYLGAGFLLEAPSPEAPTVVTSTPQVTYENVTFNATIRPNGLSTEVSFQYSLDPTMNSGVVTSSPQTLAQAGFDDVIVSSETVSGLPAGTRYYVRAVATNSLGTILGGILPFNTTPSVGGLRWSGNMSYAFSMAASPMIWGSTFTALEDSVLTHLGVYDHNQDGLSRSVPVGLWDYDTQQLLGSVLVAPSDPLVGSSRQHVLSTPVTLTAGKRYTIGAYIAAYSSDAYGHGSPITMDYRVAYNGYASRNNPSELSYPYSQGNATLANPQYFGATFLLEAPAPSAPYLVTAFPSVSESGAVLKATLRTNGLPTQVSFEYSQDSTFSSGVTTTVSQPYPAGFDNLDITSAAITDLPPLTTYYVRAVAVNSMGTTVGGVRSFNSSPPVPGYKFTGNTNGYQTQQYWSDANWGSYFTTTKACTLTHLGVYDHNQDGLAADIPVGIWDSNGNLLGSTIVRSGTTDDAGGSFRYRLLTTPVNLAANTRYFIAAYYTSNAPDPIGYGANIQTDFRINYEGYTYNNYAGQLSFPGWYNYGSSSAQNAQYFGANFLLEAPALEAPTVVTSSAGVTAAEVSFNASVTPNGLSTQVSFEYSLDPAMSSGVVTTASQTLAETDYVAVSVRGETITGLSAGTTYYVRAVATNSKGTTQGEILPFNTTPSVAGIRWSGNTPNAANDGVNRIWGSTFTALEDCVLTHLGVYDHNQDGLARSVPVGLWDYNTQQLVASVTVVPSDPLVGSSRQRVLSTPVSLTAGTRYTIGAFYPANSTDAYGYWTSVVMDYRVAYDGYASTYNPSALGYPNEIGSANANNAQYFGATFLLQAPSPSAPYVVTASPSVNESGAVLRATVRPNGLPTQVSFEYSLDNTLNSGVTTTASQLLLAGFDNLSVSSAAITGLPANSTVYVRAVAVNSLGTTVGAIRSFSTSPPVPGYKFSGNAASYQTQYYYSNNWGSYFTTTKACTLTHLGVYDHDQNGLGADIPVGIWDSSGNLLGSTSVRSGTTDECIGSFRYRQLDAPVNLAANTRYFVAAYYTSYAPDPIGHGVNLQTDYRIVYEGYTYNYHVGQLTFPGWYSNGTTSANYAQYFGANFLLEAPPQEAPSVVTSSAGVTGAEVYFNASVTPNGLSTQVSFEYSLDPAMSSGVVTTASQTLAESGYESVSVRGETITGLPAGTTYYVRAVAANSKGTTQGEILPFNTTPSVAGIRWSGNMLNYSTDGSNRMWGSTFTALEDSVLTHLGVYDHNQDGLSRSVPVGLWDYNTQQLIASVTVAPSDPLVGSSRQHVLSTPVSLTAGTRYIIAAFYAANSQDAYGYSSSITTDYRVAYDSSALSSGINALSCPNAFGSASQSNAQYFGATFLLQAPSPSAPYVLTSSPAVDASGAVLMATVRPNGLPTQVSFEYSLDNTLNSGVTTTASQLLLAGYDNLSVSSAAITGLPANSTVYVRAVAVNSLGTTVGAIRSFSTSPPVPGYKFSGNATNYQTQYYYDNNWGSYFTTTKACTLTHLGVYDHDQNGLGADIPVGIWDSNGTLLGSTTVRSGTTDERTGSFRYRQLDAPVNLAANTRYFVAAYYTSYAPDPIGHGVNLQTDNRIVYEGYTYNYYAGQLSFPGWYSYGSVAASSAQYFGAGFLLEAPSPEAPAVTTLEADVDPQTSAAPGAKVWANGLPTQLTFEYSLDASLTTGVSTTPAQNLPAGYDSVTLYAAPIYGLASNSTYYYRAVVTNSLGTAQGAVLSFKTNPPLPGYKYGQFTNYGSNAGYTWGSEFTALTNTSITHLGVYDHDQNGLQGNVDVGLWDSYGNLLASTTVTSADPLVGTSRYRELNTPVALTANERYLVAAYYTDYDSYGQGSITTDSRVAYYGYAYDTSYYYGGLRYPQYRGQTGNPDYAYYFGANFLLEAPGPQAPTVSTRRGYMRQGSATLNASVMPGLLPTQVTFEYSTDPGLSTGVSTTAAQTVIGYNPKTVASAPIGGLPENSWIYFRAVASNSLGTVYGSILSLKTSGALWNGPPVTFAKAPYSDWTQEANQDRLTANTWLTRASTQGLFNIAQQSNYVAHTSPANTEWAAGTLADFANLKFDTWYNWWGRNLSILRGTNAVLHLINEDIYLNIKFDTWTQASGGGFSYTRSTPGDETVVTSPRIVLSGNGTGIANGDSTPGTADHTDFGGTPSAGGAVTRTFTLTNSGDGALNLTGTAPNLVTLSGANAAEFSVTSQPSTPVAANGGTTTFQVSFDPSAIGTRTAIVSIASDDSTANPFTFTIQGTGMNSAPTDITLTPSSIAENNASGVVVGALAAADSDAGQSHSFTLVAGEGDTDNGSFSISGTSLNLDMVANFEVKSGYSIRLQADDGSGGTVQKVLTVSVTDVNEAPTDITLSPSSLAENNAAGATVGSLAAVDVDAGQTHGFSLVAGAGDTDNGSFSITGSSLKISAVANFEVKSSYSIRVQADDGSGGTFARALSILVMDLNEAPVIISNGGLATAAVSIAENSTSVTQVSAVDADLPSQLISYSLGGVDAALFSVNAGTGVLAFTAAPDYETPLDQNADNVYQVTVLATDNGSPTASSSQHITVTVTDVDELPEIAVLGNDNEIDSGDSTPSPTDGTDFGRVLLANSFSRSFTLTNTGLGALNLSGAPLVEVSGIHASNFAVTIMPSSTLAPQTGQTSFTLRFTPSGTGLRSALVTLRSNDPDEGTYTFAIQGTGYSNNAGRLFFAPAAYVVNQGASQAVLTINRVDGKAATSVRLTTAPGTPAAGFTAATPGLDYVHQDVIVSFPEDSTSQQVVIPLIARSGAQPNYQFNASLSDPGERTTLGTPSQATISIKAHVRPTVTVLTPRQSSVISGLAPYNVTGTCTDGGKAGINRVEVKLNGGAPANATLSPTGSYRCDVLPVNGLNTLEVTAFDNRGVSSLPVSVTFTFTRHYKLEPPVSSLGAVAVVALPASSMLAVPRMSYKTVLPGAVVKMTATPKGTNTVFSHWTGLPADAVVNGNVMTFTMPAQDVLGIVAVYNPNTFKAPAGEGKTFYGILQPASSSQNSIKTLVFLTGTMTDTGAFTGKVLVGGLAKSFSAQFFGDGSSTFGVTKTPTLGISSDCKMSLTYLNGNVEATVSTLVGSTVIASGTARRIIYTLSRPIPPRFQNTISASSSGVPDSGFFSLAMPAKTQSPERDLSSYPQGDGFGTILMSKDGLVTYAGTLADDSKFTASTGLVAGNNAPFLAQIGSPGKTTEKGACLTGTLAFNTAPSNSDVTATNLIWIRPAAPLVSLYTAGWPGGIHLDAIGALYNKSQGVYATLSTGSAPANGGVCELYFASGKLNPDISVTSFSINSLNEVRKVPLSNTTFTLVLTPNLAAFSGTFTPNWSGASKLTKPAFKGILLQKGASKGGYGFFISNRLIDADPESGRVTLGLP